MSADANTITVKGRGTPLLFVIFIISTIAVAMPLGLTASGHQLPLGNVVGIWLVVLLVDLGLFVVALYYFSRRLTLKGDLIQISTIFGRKVWRVGEITAISVQTEVSGGEHATIQDYLAFWQNGRLLGRLNLFSVPRESLARFLGTVCRRNPNVTLAPEAELLVRGN